MSCLGVVINILFFFAKLPEVAQVVSAETKDVVSMKGFFKKYHTIAGFFAEFAYVSANGSAEIITKLTAPSIDRCSRYIFSSWTKHWTINEY